MNPEKLFDYLEGNLKAEDRAQLEKQLATDPQLQRELDIAREMHRRARGSREVLGESEDLAQPLTPSGKLGRHLIAVFALLVVVNVLVGIAFSSAGKNRISRPNVRARELAIRQQLTASLQKTAESALPAPRLAAEEIFLSAPDNEREALANNVVMLATQSGRIRSRRPHQMMRVSPSWRTFRPPRAEEFRRALAPLAQADFASPAPQREEPDGPGKNKYLRSDHPRALQDPDSVSDDGPMIALAFALPSGEFGLRAPAHEPG